MVGDAVTLEGGVEAMTEAAFRTGDFTAAEALISNALSEAPDRSALAAALHASGWLMHFRALESIVDGRVTGGDPDAEEELFQRALDIRRELGDHAGVAASLFGVGLVRQVLRRDPAGAIPLFREALALAEEHGDDLTRSELHRHIGFHYLGHEQRPDEAVHHLRESLALRERHGDERWIPSGLLVLGQAELRAGRRDEGLMHLRAAVKRAREARLRPERIAHAESALASAVEAPSARHR
jgi:tetratricopeptide (TPR) repeat protein